MNKIIKYSIYALVILMPLAFLPFTAEVLEFPKQMILVALTLLALIGWIGRMIVKKSLTLRVSVLDLAVFIFLGIWGIATLLSQAPYGSLVGLGGSMADSFLSVLCFGVLYFVIVNNISTKKELTKVEQDTNDQSPMTNEEESSASNGDQKLITINGIINVFLVSAGATIILGILQMLGIGILPWAFAQGKAFNTIGTLSALGIFAGLVLSIVALRETGAKQTRKVLRWGLAVLCLLALIFINFWMLWLGLALIMGFVLVLSIAIPKSFGNKSLTLVMAVVLVSLIFLFVRTPLVNLNLPAEVSLSQKASFGITREVLREHPLLGSGPNTFGFDYSKWRSPDINNTLFWNIRFNQASSKFVSLLATTGILGVLGFFLLVIGFLWMVIRRTPKIGQTQGLPLLVPFFFLLLASFLYPANLTLTFFFFLFFILGAGVLLQRKVFRVNFSYSGRANQVLTFIALILIILILSGLWFEAKRVMAQVYFKKAITTNAEGKPAEETRALMVKAVNFDQRQDLLWRNLAESLLLETAEKVNQGKTAQEIQPLISDAVTSVKKATELSPGDVANWQARARVYENLIGLVGRAEDWAEESYKKAIELEPNNPYLYTQLGRVYLVTQDEAKVYEAIKWFEKAIELKGDYSPAHFQMALAYERVGDLDKAIEKMESNKLYTPNDVGLRFQLGLMYYKKENLAKARIEFVEAVRLSPQYSNARYFLGLVYDREGKTEQAIGQFEEIRRLNPANQEVKTILSNLRTGKSAFGVQKVKELPIEEKGPEEIPPSPEL